MVNVTTDTQNTSAVEWGIKAQTGVLTDVLLGKKENTDQTIYGLFGFHFGWWA